jgi:hypothetical protein
VTVGQLKRGAKEKLQALDDDGGGTTATVTDTGHTELGVVLFQHTQKSDDHTGTGAAAHHTTQHANTTLALGRYEMRRDESE